MTLDRDFTVYRRHGRQAMPLLAPFAYMRICAMTKFSEKVVLFGFASMLSLTNALAGNSVPYVDLFKVTTICL